MASEQIRRVALVAGANGLIGRHLTAHLARQGWDVIALSRKPVAGAARRFTADLADPAGAPGMSAALRDVTPGITCSLPNGT